MHQVVQSICRVHPVTVPLKNETLGSWRWHQSPVHSITACSSANTETAVQCILYDMCMTLPRCACVRVSEHSVGDGGRGGFMRRVGGGGYSAGRAGEEVITSGCVHVCVQMCMRAKRVCPGVFSVFACVCLHPMINTCSPDDHGPPPKRPGRIH